MKNCIKIVVLLSEVIHPCGRVIGYLSKLVFFCFQIPLYMNFFRGKKTFSMSEIADLKKHIYVYMFLKKFAYNRYCSANR